MRTPDPQRCVAMIAKGVVGIRVQEHVERAVVQRQPFHDASQLRPVECNLKRPFWMRSDGAFVETADLHDAVETLRNFLPQLPCRVAAGGVEVDMRMPVRNRRYIEKGHRNSCGEKSITKGRLPRATGIARGKLVIIFSHSAYALPHHFAVGIANSAPLSVLSDQRCMIDF